MVSAKRRKAAKRAWVVRRRKYGKDGLTKKGLAKVKRAARKKKR